MRACEQAKPVLAPLPVFRPVLAVQNPCIVLGVLSLILFVRFSVRFVQDQLRKTCLFECPLLCLYTWCSPWCLRSFSAWCLGHEVEFTCIYVPNHCLFYLVIWPHLVKRQLLTLLIVYLCMYVRILSFFCSFSRCRKRVVIFLWHSLECIHLHLKWLRQKIEPRTGRKSWKGRYWYLHGRWFTV